MQKQLYLITLNFLVYVGYFTFQGLIVTLLHE